MQPYIQITRLNLALSKLTQQQGEIVPARKHPAEKNKSPRRSHNQTRLPKTLSCKSIHSPAHKHSPKNTLLPYHMYKKKTRNPTYPKSKNNNHPAVLLHKNLQANKKQLTPFKTQLDKSKAF